MVDGKMVKVTRTHRQWHFGIVYGMKVVFHVSPRGVILCSLHWELQVLPLLIAGIVAKNLDVSWSKPEEGPQCKLLCDVVSHFGRNVLPLEQPAKFPDLTGDRTLYGRHGRLASGLRVDGNTARNWNAGWEPILNVVFHDRKTSRNRNRAFKASKKIIDHFLEYRKLLHTPYDYIGRYQRPMALCTMDEVHILWEERARMAEKIAVQFLKLFRKHCPGIGNCSWYLHCMLAHIPDNIRDVGLVEHFSTEAMEAGHTWTNNILLNCSNSIPGERMLQVMTARTTAEHTIESLPDVQAAEKREDIRNIKKKFACADLCKTRCCSTGRY